MSRCHIVHVVYSFGIGGLENVIVQLVNRLPADKYDHTIMSLTTISDFKHRITRPEVRFIELHKQPGHAIPLYPKIYKLLRQLRPQVLHTCNLAALELVPLGWLARVPLRIHAEHGWDAHDPNGTNPHYIKVRKLYRPFVSHYVAVSEDIDQYLTNKISIPPNRRHLIANGVDTDCFRPRKNTFDSPEGFPFQVGKHWLIGTVGRMQTVKNQPALARAFVKLRGLWPEKAQDMRLIMIGDGPLKQEVEETLLQGNAWQATWLPGSRSDVADILRMLNCFVLPSRAEGTSCTLQEAMASGIPCVATAVGGTPKLIKHGENGYLVSPDNEIELTEAIWQVFEHAKENQHLGIAARKTALQYFSIDGMISKYDKIFSLPHT